MKKILLSAILWPALALSSPQHQQQVSDAPPTVAISRTGILINGKAAALGQSISDWKKILPGRPRCHRSVALPVFNLCTWDEFGLSLEEYRTKVYLFRLSFVIPPLDKLEMNFLKDPDLPPEPDMRPAHTYTGRAEIDGYRIDAGTSFADAKQNIDPERELACDNDQNCTHSKGRYFDKQAHLYLVNSRSDAASGLTELVLAARPWAYSNLPILANCDA